MLKRQSYCDIFKKCGLSNTVLEAPGELGDCPGFGVSAGSGGARQILVGFLAFLLRVSASFSRFWWLSAGFTVLDRLSPDFRGFLSAFTFPGSPGALLSCLLIKFERCVMEFIYYIILKLAFLGEIMYLVF